MRLMAATIGTFLQNTTALRGFRAQLQNNIADQLDGPIVDRLDQCILALGREGEQNHELEANRKNLVAEISSKLDRSAFQAALEVLLGWFNDLALLKNGLELKDSLAIERDHHRAENYKIILRNLADFFSAFEDQARDIIETAWKKVTHHNNFYEQFLDKQVPERIKEIVSLQEAHPER